MDWKGPNKWFLNDLGWVWNIFRRPFLTRAPGQTKTRIYIKKDYSVVQNHSFKTNIHCLKKTRTLIQNEYFFFQVQNIHSKKDSFFKRGRIAHPYSSVVKNTLAILPMPRTPPFWKDFFSLSSKRLTGMGVCFTSAFTSFVFITHFDRLIMKICIWIFSSYYVMRCRDKYENTPLFFWQ